MPCEPLDALDDLRKQALGQLAFHQLHYEVPGMSDEASAGLEQFARGLLHGPRRYDDAPTARRLGPSGSCRGLPITRPMPSAPNIRVLVAEDDKDVRDLLCDVLRADGFMVVAVEDGTQAIRAFRRQDFDVVLTDLALPGYNGLQVAQACKRQRPSVKVVMLTAWDLLLDDKQCIHHGVDRLIPKPLGMSTLMEALHDVGKPARYQRVPRTPA